MGVIKREVSAGSVHRKVDQGPVTLAADETAVDLSLGRFFVTQANTGATAITTLSNVEAGMKFTIIGGSDTNATTIAVSGSFANIDGAMTLGDNESITLYAKSSSDVVELSRTEIA